MNNRDLHCQDKLPLPVGSLQELALIAYLNTNRFDLDLVKRVVNNSETLSKLELTFENITYRQRYKPFWYYYSILHILEYIERERKFKCKPIIYVGRCLD